MLRLLEEPAIDDAGSVEDVAAGELAELAHVHVAAICLWCILQLKQADTAGDILELLLTLAVLEDPLLVQVLLRYLFFLHFFDLRSKHLDIPDVVHFSAYPSHHLIDFTQAVDQVLGLLLVGAEVTHEISIRLNVPPEQGCLLRDELDFKLMPPVSHLLVGQV